MTVCNLQLHSGFSHNIQNVNFDITLEQNERQNISNKLPIPIEISQWYDSF